MKLLSLKVADGFHPAVLIGDDVLDLVLAKGVLAGAEAVPGDMKSLLAAGPAMLETVLSIASADRRSVDAVRKSCSRSSRS
jgi:hypothetical protein